MAVVYFGPWYGELGWELCTWQGFCRKQAKRFDKVYVSSFPDMEALYRDFAEFIPHGHSGRALDWTDISNIDYDVPEGVDVHVKPHKQYRVPDQDFIKFGSEPLGVFSCLVHARNLGRGSSKNYPQGLWEQVVKGLPGRVASIGTDSDLHLEGTEDLRNIPLNDLMNYIAGSLVVMGGSSGVMHLATLCGIPIVVWADGRTYFGETLEKRYKDTWNPLGTRVEYLYDDNWKPDPQAVIEAVQKVMPDIESEEVVVGAPHELQIPMETIRIGGEEIEVPAELAARVLSVVKKPISAEREITITLESTMADSVEAAMQVGKWFLTVSYANPLDPSDKGRLHHWQTHDYPRSDLISTLEHLKTDVASKDANPAEIRQREEASRGVLRVPAKGFGWR